MAAYSIIRKSELEGHLRMDAEYYQPEYLNLVKVLEESKAVSIRSVVATPKIKFQPHKDEPFQYIEISEVDLLTGEYNQVEILGENAPDRAQWIVRPDDVIVSLVRPIRNAVSLIGQDVKNLVCSSGFAVLKPEKIEPEYLFVYLKLDSIIKLLDRRTTATMYPAITVEDVLETKIYLGDKNFREDIKNQVVELRKELANSRLFYAQAEQLLLKELGLENFEREAAQGLNFAIVSLSEIKKADRMDSEYFQVIHKKMIEKVVAKLKILTVFDIFEFVRGMFVPTEFYTNEKTKRPFIRIKELTGRVGINEQEVIFLNEKYPNDTKNTLLENDLVVAIIGDTIGRVNLIEKELAGGFCSNNMVRLRIKKEWDDKFLPEFAEILLQSSFIQRQIRQKMAQTGQPKINDKELKNMVIPILPQQTQQKIAELVRKSHQARREAQELLAQAKQKVEKLIEN